jgi:hypothetical protein
MSVALNQWIELLRTIAECVMMPIIRHGLPRIQIDGREQVRSGYSAAQLEVECDLAGGIVSTK